MASALEVQTLTTEWLCCVRTNLISCSAQLSCVMGLLNRLLLSRRIRWEAA